MTGSRNGGNSRPMSRDDFNLRAKALSERLGPIAKAEAPPRQNYARSRGQKVETASKPDAAPEAGSE